MATTEAEAPVEQPKTDAEKTTAELFRYAAYVHVGTGALECPLSAALEDPERDRSAELPTCTDPEHFHAWCRLPNQLQHDDLRKRAAAARARRVRQLRDPETDAYVVLENDLDDLRRSGDRELLLTALLVGAGPLDRLEAMRDVEDREDFQHHTEDVDRLREIQAMPEEQQPAEERDELTRHMQRYWEAVEAEIEQRQQPRRAGLEGLSVDELVDQLRDQRIGQEGDQAFQDYYSMYQWFVCTLKPTPRGRPRERAFVDLNELAAAAPEVIAALRATYRELELSLQRGQTGNW